MKKLVIRVLFSVLAFLFGMAVSRLTTSETPTATELTRFETTSLAIPQTPVLPIPQSPTIAAQPTSAVAKAENIIIIDFNVEKFVPSGYYYFTGSAPKGFKEFAGIDLSTWEDEDQRHSDLSFSSLHNEGYNSHRARFALITKERFFFVTETFESGFEYRFDGQFLRDGVISDAPQGRAVLRGKLTKSKNGRTVAEREVNFQIEVHGC